MKKLGILILLLSLMLVACSSEIVGTWQGEGEELEFTKDEFYADGELICNYHIDGDQLVLEYEGMEFEIEFKLDGDSLTMTDEGDSYTYERVK